MTEKRDPLFDAALALIHAHRAASVALLERRLGVDRPRAEALLVQVARETPAVTLLASGLFLYLPEQLADELGALRTFAGAVLTALQTDSIDPARLRASAIAAGLTVPEQFDVEDPHRRAA
ncbi:hypothetical protein [Cupriavidus basilensis]|uniref:hypothetical protein n=1 Tax=Cupriavidus basilensis TaxID=68895 RepID=UPI0007512774|nr:hypothetical protein [Cupriavidus basilensis]